MTVENQNRNDSNNANTTNCNIQENSRNQLIEQIRCLEFAITDISLYLDTHPDDYQALCLHKKYCKECQELKNQYQKMYGPLTINFPCNKWRWLEEPWPWERGNF